MTQPSAHARLTLHDAFERFAATVTPDDKRDFSSTTLEHVRDEAIRIERQLRARRTQKNMARLDPFLRGMEHYSKVVEVLCNGTPYLSWIWAPVKLMLMISIDSLGAFEKLIEAYGKIADMLPRFDRLAMALGNDHNFQAILALVYSDILEFHRRAYKFVRRKSWAIFFGSMWAGFESRFSSILRSLAYHGELVDKEAVAVDISDAVARSKEEADRWEQQESEWEALKVRTVLSWLATDDLPPEDTLERYTRDCLLGSCDWFIQCDKTQSWLNDGTESTILWLYGKPGAGKSTLCSRLVQHAEEKGTNIFYYFCNYFGNSTKSSSRLLRSLAAQIVQKHRYFALHIYEKYSQLHLVPSRKVLLDLLPELLQGLASVRIAIDGIDEWDERDQKEVLQDLTKMLSADLSSICKIMISSRDTLEISRILRKSRKMTESISLSDADEGIAIDRSIGHFVDNRLSELPDHMDELDPDASIVAQIKHTLVEKSNGMFLWVRLVLDSLDTVYSAAELRNLVEDLPSDLEALYERIFHRLCRSRGSQGYGGVPRMLSWICFSRRPLHRHELLHGLAILPTDINSEPQSVPVAQILDHCKPFIEERSDLTVILVHFSVKEFFMKAKAPQIIQPIQAQFDMSFACATTLSRGLDFLRSDVAPSENLLQIATGTYRLLPYALENWVEHCLLYNIKKGLADFDQLLLSRLTSLREKHDQLSQRTDSNEPAHSNAFEAPESQLDDRLKLMVDLPIYDLMRQVLSVRQLTTKQLCKNGEDAEAFAVQNDQTLFSKLASDFENAVIHLLSKYEITGIPKAVLESFQKSYASTAFRCRFPDCSKAFAGFASPEIRSHHEAAHFRRVYCRAEDCQYSRIGFKDKSGLDSHIRKYHNEKCVLSVPPKIRHTPKDKEPSQHRDRRKSNRSEDDVQKRLPSVHTSDTQKDLQPSVLPTSKHIEAISPPAVVRADPILEVQNQSSQQQHVQLFNSEDVPNPQDLSNDLKEKFMPVVQNLWRAMQVHPIHSTEHIQAREKLGSEAKIEEARKSYLTLLPRQHRNAQHKKRIGQMLKEQEKNWLDYMAGLLNVESAIEKEYDLARQLTESFKKEQVHNASEQQRYTQSPSPHIRYAAQQHL